MLGFQVRPFVLEVFAPNSQWPRLALFVFGGDRELLRGTSGEQGDVDRLHLWHQLSDLQHLFLELRCIGVSGAAGATG